MIEAPRRDLTPDEAAIAPPNAGELRRRTYRDFVVTALPADGAFDPDLVASSQMNAWLTLSTAR